LARLQWLILLLVFLTACTATPVKKSNESSKAVYQARADKIAAIGTWGFVGKLSVDDGEDGGSGRLQWDVQSKISELDFHGAMGRGAWQLKISPEGAILREADGSVQTAAGVDALIQDRMGWPIPVDALQWWVRGLAAPGPVEGQVLTPEGLLLKLDQFGWIVDFNRYDSAAGVAMPIRLDARQGSYRVKLAIGRWQIDAGDGD
jgi:outer membrane lipoprotein LolB